MSWRKNKPKARQRHFQKLSFGQLQGVVRRAGVQEQVEATQALHYAHEVLVERFGDGVAVHVKPTYVRHRRLALQVAHPAIMEELKKQEEALVAEINKRMGRPEITRLEFLFPEKSAEEGGRLPEELQSH